MTDTDKTNSSNTKPPINTFLMKYMKQEGLVWENDVSGHLSYGPVGIRIKRNLEDQLRKHFQDEFEEVCTPLILPKEVWERSTHWSRFNDPVVKTAYNKMYRLDHLLAERYNMSYEEHSFPEIYEVLKNDKEMKFILPEHVQQFTRDVVKKSLMMKTLSRHREAALRSTMSLWKMIL